MKSKFFLSFPLVLLAAAALVSCNDGGSSQVGSSNGGPSAEESRPDGGNQGNQSGSGSILTPNDPGANSSGNLTIEDCALTFYRSNAFSTSDLLGSVELGNHNEVPIAGYGSNQYLYVCFEMSKYDNQLDQNLSQLSFVVRISGLQGFTIEGNSTYSVQQINNGETYEVSFNTTRLESGEVDTFLRLPFYMKRSSVASSGSNQRADFEVSASIVGNPTSSTTIMRTQSTFSWDGGTTLGVGDPVLDTATGLVTWTVDENTTECRVSASYDPTSVSSNLISSPQNQTVSYQIPRSEYEENGLLTIRAHSDRVGYEDVDKLLTYKVLSTPELTIETAVDSELRQTFTMHPQLGTSSDLYTNRLKIGYGRETIETYDWKSAIDVTSLFELQASGRADLQIAASYEGAESNIIDSDWSNAYTLQKLSSPSLSLSGANLAWDAIMGATLYGIYENDALLNTTTDTFYRIGSSYGKVYKVKAVFDPTVTGGDRGNAIYVNSEFSNSVTSNIA